MAALGTVPAFTRIRTLSGVAQRTLPILEVTSPCLSFNNLDLGAQGEMCSLLLFKAITHSLSCRFCSFSREEKQIISHTQTLEQLFSLLQGCTAELFSHETELQWVGVQKLRWPLSGLFTLTSYNPLPLLCHCPWAGSEIFEALEDRGPT